MVAFDKTFSLEGIRKVLQREGNVDAVDFAHYPWVQEEEETIRDIFLEFSSSWTSISFHGTVISDNFLSKLLFYVQSNIVSLDLSSIKLTNDTAFALSHSLHSNTLKILKLGSSRLSDSGIIELATHCPNLSELHLSGCSRITDNGLIESLVAKSKRNYAPFTVLMLSACKHITDKGIIYLAESQGEYLKRVSLSFCYLLSDRSILVFSKYAKNLKAFNLCGCKNIGDESAYSIFTNCLKLKSLSLNSCKGISIETLYSLNEKIRYLDKLYYFDLRSCPLLEEKKNERGEIVQEILQKKTKLRLRLKN